VLTIWERFVGISEALSAPMNNTLISAALQNTANEKINKIVAVIFIRHFPFKVPIFDNLII